MGVATTGVKSGTERTVAEQLRVYLDITRPRVIALVLFTGIPSSNLVKMRGRLFGRRVGFSWVRLWRVVRVLH